MSELVGLPVADVWWVRERVDDGITRVTEPHVHPFLRCNVWHVQGRDADLVVDTGMGIRPLRPFVERELEGDLIAVATHAHTDHVGGLHEFDYRAIHEAEASIIAVPLLGELDASAYGDESIGVYRAAGYTFDDHLVDAVPAGGIEAFYEVPAACISPQAGTGSCTPSPRKLSDASSRIAWPTKAVIMIRYGAITFGTCGAG